MFAICNWLWSIYCQLQAYNLKYNKLGLFGPSLVYTRLRKVTFLPPGELDLKRVPQLFPLVRIQAISSLRIEPAFS